MGAFGGEDAESYYDEGLTAMMKGNMESASQFFIQALKRDPDMIAAKHQLGKCFLRLGDTHRAVLTLTQVVKQKPDLVAAHLDFGYALLAEAAIVDDVHKPALLTAAQHQFADLQVSQPGNVRALLGLAQTAFQAGEWGQALGFAQEAHTRGGANFSVLFLLGRVAKLAGRTELSENALTEASALVEHSTELEPNAPESYFLRAEVCFTQGAFAEALDYFSAAEKRAEPDKFYTAFGEYFSKRDILAKRGLCFQRLGDLASAREMGQSILAEDPSHRLAQMLAKL